MKRSHRKTKIIATLGPATDSPGAVEKLLLAGVDVFRLNFSHGTHKDHLARIEAIRAAARTTGKDVAILQDVQGPKVRVGMIEGGKMVLKSGAELTLLPKPVLGRDNTISHSFPKLYADLKPGMTVTMDDGSHQLKVLKVFKEKIILRCMTNGILIENKGINFPDARLSFSSLTKKDWMDIEFGIRQGVDYIALSFIQDAKPIQKLRKTLAARKSRIGIIAKVETLEGIRNIEEIIDATDAVLVARGDLGAETPLGQVPILQKELINRTHAHFKPVITATQMLESMTHRPKPTRAETSDVANAVFDGTDTVMLSAETASGEFPVEAVQAMDQICEAAEGKYLYQLETSANIGAALKHTVPCAIIQSTFLANRMLKLKAVAALTHSGATARLLSTVRLSATTRAFGFTPFEEVARQMHLLWGITPIIMPAMRDLDKAAEYVQKALLSHGYAKSGDSIALIAGTPMAKPGSTNTLKIYTL